MHNGKEDKFAFACSRYAKKHLSSSVEMIRVRALQLVGRLCDGTFFALVVPWVADRLQTYLTLAHSVPELEPDPDAR